VPVQKVRRQPPFSRQGKAADAIQPTFLWFSLPAGAELARNPEKGSFLAKNSDFQRKMPHHFPKVTHHLPLVMYFFRLVTHHLRLVTHFFRLVTHHLRLVTHFFRLVMHHLAQVMRRFRRKTRPF
jgi:hypothetical protein